MKKLLFISILFSTTLFANIINEYPSNTYDRYLDSRWAGTDYEGIFSDMVLVVMPFDGFTEGFWCNNVHGGDCKRDDNFPTYYILSNNGDSNYLNKICEENF